MVEWEDDVPQYDSGSGDIAVGADAAGEMVDRFLAASTEAELGRVRDQLEAKEEQIQRCIQTYEAAVDRLETQLRQVSDRLSRLSPRAAERERLEPRRDRLCGELRDVRHRFQRDLRELEDEKLELEREVEELVEARFMVDTF